MLRSLPPRSGEKPGERGPVGSRNVFIARVEVACVVELVEAHFVGGADGRQNEGGAVRVAECLHRFWCAGWPATMVRSVVTMNGLDEAEVPQGGLQVHQGVVGDLPGGCKQRAQDPSKGS